MNNSSHQSWHIGLKIKWLKCCSLSSHLCPLPPLCISPALLAPGWSHMVDWSKPGCWGEWGTGALTVAAGAEISLSRLGWKHKHISPPLPTACLFIMTGHRVHCVHGLNSVPSHQMWHCSNTNLFLYNVGKYRTCCCPCLAQTSEVVSSKPFSPFHNHKHTVSAVNKSAKTCCITTICRTEETGNCPSVNAFYSNYFAHIQYFLIIKYLTAFFLMPLPRYQHNSSQILNTICYPKELSGLYILPFLDDQV